MYIQNLGVFFMNNKKYEQILQNIQLLLLKRSYNY